MRKLPAAISALVLLLVGEDGHARVTRFVVEERVPFASGMEWGSAGPYERLRGTAYMEVDPADPLNAVIVNLDKAPRNARGRVEFSAPFMILKPVDMKRGNSKIWYAINNRGRYCIDIAYRSFPSPARVPCVPGTVEDIGASNYLLQQGYVVVDAGWHGDGVPGEGAVYPDFPVARESDGRPITGKLRIEYSPARDTYSLPLAGDFRPYAPADPVDPQAVLTVRDRPDAPRAVIPRNRWAFGRCPDGEASLAVSAGDLCLFDGFKAGKVYELTYTAKDPIVMGLAHAVTRDVASFLRYATHDDAGNPNPLAVTATSTGIRRAYSSGTSSTGMYLREFLYLGFNEDESHRKVFDGVTILSGGAYRLFANVQFAHPTYYSRQDANRDYVSNAVAPFTFAVTTDPLSGVRDGILKRPKTDPLVMQIDEETAFWQWKASLNVVDARGAEVPIPQNVRLYYLNGFGHISASGLLALPRPLPGASFHGGDESARAPTLRALARAMDDWADRGIAPPPSNYPRKQHLVTLEQYRARFPKIPGMAPPAVMAELPVLNFGPRFNATGGVQDVLPPIHGPRYTLLVPAPRAGGDSVAGINSLLTRVPLGTNVGWNYWNGAWAPHLFSLRGSYLPFAKTKAERDARGDPRLSLEERYKDHEGFVRAVRAGAAELVQERFLLPEDAETYIRAAQESRVLKDPSSRLERAK